MGDRVILEEIAKSIEQISSYAEQLRIVADEMRRQKAEEATALQFVAEYFRNQDRQFDYTQTEECWNGYVANVAEAGRILERAVQAYPKEKLDLDQWYSILEIAARCYRKELQAKHPVENLPAVFKGLLRQFEE